MANPELVPPQYAASGINWQCLSTQMEVVYTTNYPNYYYGNVVCEGGNFALGIALAAAIIVVHLVFLITPIFLGLLILDIQPRLEPKIRSFNLLVMSMPLYVLATAGEIGQHVFDNWLFLDARVSIYNFTFFFFNFLSNSVAADALGTGVIQRLVTILFSLLIPLLYVYERYVAQNKTIGVVSLIPLYASLFIATLFFIFRASLTLGGLCCRQLVLATLVLVFYIAGVIFGILTLETGYQFWHLPTGSSFLVGFSIQAYWILSVRALARDPKRQPLLLQITQK
eukprot:jgi/Botrbrau1/2327/Bobra.39_1s0016.1